MRSKSNLKTACTITMPPEFIDICGCQCSSFGTYAVHKVVPVRLLISEKLNYYMTSLRGKNEVKVKFENSMHNYNATRVH